MDKLKLLILVFVKGKPSWKDKIIMLEHQFTCQEKAYLQIYTIKEQMFGH